MPVFLLRASSVVVGGTTFGLLAAELLPYPPPVAAVLAACAFGMIFLCGTGYRILIAVARRDPEAETAVSWSGATAAVAIAVLVALPLVGAREGAAALLLAAFGIAIDAAYLPVKTACRLAGCCHARRSILPLLDHLDLRVVEIVVTSAILVVAGAAMFLGDRPLAALVATGGHFVERSGSRWARRRLPTRWWPLPDPGFELVPLALVALFAAREWVTAF